MNKLMSIAFDPGKCFAEELRLIIQMFDNRIATGDPLIANEYLLQISREKYERLCRLSLEALQNRYKHSGSIGNRVMYDDGTPSREYEEHPTKTSDS